MISENAVRAAEMLMQVRMSGDLIDGLPDDLRPGSPEEAYAIQDAYVPFVHGKAGGSMLGYKAGATNPAAMERMALEEPFRAVLLSAFAHPSGASVPAEACFMRVLEVEFAFRMADDLPPAAFPYDQDAVRAAVGTLIPAIEVVDSRYADWTQVGGLQVIADNGSAGLWVYGQEREDWHGLDLGDLSASLKVDGELVQEGHSSAVLDSPLNSLTWLANSLCLAGKGLKAGDVVTTGTVTAPHVVGTGHTCTADFGDLGEVSITFEA